MKRGGREGEGKKGEVGRGKGVFLSHCLTGVKGLFAHLIDPLALSSRHKISYSEKCFPYLISTYYCVFFFIISSGLIFLLVFKGTD